MIIVSHEILLIISLVVTEVGVGLYIRLQRRVCGIDEVSVGHLLQN